MICKSYRNIMLKRGMTLAEVVMAIAVIAFCIPLILAATGAAHRSRQDAEADTRSSWLVRDVQRRINNEWSEILQPFVPKISFPFPSEDSSEATMELAYKQDGTLITAEANDHAVYLVTAEARAYVPDANHSTPSSLALITIQIQYPAKASPNHRKKLTYRFVSARDGIL